MHELVWDFETSRQELLWELEWAGPGWERRGVHPYRGEVSLPDYVHEINERDLDAMWNLRRLREEAEALAS